MSSVRPNPAVEVTEWDKLPDEVKVLRKGTGISSSKISARAPTLMALRCVKDHSRLHPSLSPAQAAYEVVRCAIGRAELAPREKLILLCTLNYPEGGKKLKTDLESFGMRMADVDLDES